MYIIQYTRIMETGKTLSHSLVIVLLYGSVATHGHSPSNSLKVQQMGSLYSLLGPKFFIYLNLLTHTYFSLQGLILSNALRAQKDAEDEGCAIALSNLRSEIIELRNEGLEKDKILHSLINKIKEDEAAFKGQAEAQKREIEDLRKQLARAKE
jgi:hypothetical protein